MVALVGAGYYLLTAEGRQLIDRARIKLVRDEHQSRFRAGEKLVGTPDLERLNERLDTHGVRLGAQVYLRIFKFESELELWVHKEDRFIKLATYPICFWSGRLGPKLKEHDLQAPEGFYTISAQQLNPNSRNHRSLNLGYPNVFDQAHGRTGSALQVHGGCRSVGCYAMTDPVIDEIWRVVTAALEKRQPRVPVHIFPFRMTGLNLEWRHGYHWENFWANLKEAYDRFEETQVPPVVSVCNGRYIITTGTTETFSSAVNERCPPEF